MNEELAKDVTTRIESLEREISQLIDDVIKDTNMKIDHKVSQASRKGRSSENCAKTAGAKLMKDVEKALEDGLRKEQKSLEAIRRSIEDKTISEKQFEDLKNPFLEKKIELAMTNTEAKIEALTLNYARVANSC
ncbi:uncharacterized protein LOC106667346 isoform X2 [Cimex lectularius]|nr:uncharacterized protein LOC106667346 isoform X2 [Cimex lectularius]